MRRAFEVLLVATVLASCSSPALRLEPSFVRGEVRLYSLVSDVSTRIEVPGLHTHDRTRLEASSRVEVTAAGPKGSTLRVTVTPRRFRRNGRSAEAPGPQEAVVHVGPDGVVTKVERNGPDDGGDEDVGVLIGSQFRRGRVHLADRWRRSVTGAGGGTGTQTGRLAALRFVMGFPCAIVDLATTRPVSRTADRAGQTLALVGNEVTAAEVAFAYLDGIPVRLTSDGEARFAVTGVSASPDSVVIVTHTELRLERRTTASA